MLSFRDAKHPVGEISKSPEDINTCTTEFRGRLAISRVASNFLALLVIGPVQTELAQEISHYIARTVTSATGLIL